MKPRLVILVVLAGILAVAFAMRSSAPKTEDDMQLSTVAKKDMAAVRDQQRMIWQFELPGEEPEEEAVFDVNVRVDTSTGKNRLVLEVSEEHGYYVEYLKAAVWYVENEGDNRNDTRFEMTHRLNRYLKAGETLTECFELVPAELGRIGGSIGESQNWRAEIDSYHRARVANPKKFPPVGGTNKCDG